jgi:UDP-N-acetylglucosamine 2-epimerase (non-hydrolysing)
VSSDSRHRVVAVIGTRPEAIKLGPVVRELRTRGGFFDPIVIWTGQHREMLRQAVALFDLTPDVDLDLMREDQRLGEYAARALSELTREFERLRPDAVLVQGDTTTAAMAALAAFYQGVIVGHVEAGLRSFDLENPFPEEMNRRGISVVSRLHFAPTPRARDNLLREGVSEDTVFVTGNTIVDALTSIDLSGGWDDPDLARIDFSATRVLLVTAHRRESLEVGLSRICEALRRLASRDDVTVLYPVHLNPRVQQVAQEMLSGLKRVELVSPLSYPDLLRVLERCAFVLTDSGGIQEESPSFGKPVLVMREVTERPEVIECGAGLLVGTDPDRIVREASRLLDDADAYERMATVENPFGDGKAAARIVDVLSEALESR